MATSNITVKISVKKRLYFWPCFAVCRFLVLADIFGEQQAAKWLFKNCVKVRVE